MTESNDLTGLIQRALAGDSGAANAVFEIAYPELCRRARMRLGSSARGATLDTAAVVHESFLRLVESGRVRVSDRQHFLRYAGRVMRAVIVDTVRERAAQRRGGDLQRVSLTGAGAVDRHSADANSELEILDLHAALTDLAEQNEQMADVVEMRYFAGMTEAEIAEVLGISDRSVRRIWTRARVWLADALSGQ